MSDWLNGGDVLRWVPDAEPMTVRLHSYSRLLRDGTFFTVHYWMP